MERGEIVCGPQTLRQLVEFTAGTGQLNSDPSLPIAAAAEFRGVLPLLENRAFRLRWRRTVAEEDSEVVSLGGNPPGVEQLHSVVAQDAQAQLDEGAATGESGMSNLWTAYPLRGGPGCGTPSPVTLGVSTGMLEQEPLSLDGPFTPSGRGRPEMPVVGRAGILSQKGLEFVVWDPGGSD